MSRISLALVLLLWSAPGVGAQPVASKLPATPLQQVAALPEVLAGWRRGQVTDFEARPNGAGLGAAAEYRPEAGGPGVATLYRYDRGLSEAAALASMPAELDQAVREVEMLGPQRRYRVEGRAPAAPLPPLRCEYLVLAFEGGARAESFICLGVVRGGYLKLRLTLPPAAPGVAEQTVQALLREAVAAAAR